MDRPDELIPNDVAQRRHRKRTIWEAKWSQPGYAPPWLGRGVSDEIVAAVESRWFAPGSYALDIGCGEGAVAGWLAEHGFPTVGLDIAPSAIARARKHCAGGAGTPEFLALDICEAPPPDRQYAVIVDRGCLHQIFPVDWPSYLENVVKVAAPGARMLLYMKAFRNGIPTGDPAERRRVIGEVEQALGSHFTTIRHALTSLDPHDGTLRKRGLPGMVFWLVRRS
jgi:SAM-dependent methyltransferase